MPSHYQVLQTFSLLVVLLSRHTQAQSEILGYINIGPFTTPALFNGSDPAFWPNTTEPECSQLYGLTIAVSAKGEKVLQVGDREECFVRGDGNQQLSTADFPGVNILQGFQVWQQRRLFIGPNINCIIIGTMKTPGNVSFGFNSLGDNHPSGYTYERDECDWVEKNGIRISCDDTACNRLYPDPHDIKHKHKKPPM